MAKCPLLLVVIVVVVVGFVLFEAGFFSDLVGGPAAQPAGNVYAIQISSLTVAGSSPAISIGDGRTDVSGSQAVMGGMTSISFKLAVRHVSGSAGRSFDIALTNPSWSSGGFSWNLFKQDQSGCIALTMSADS